MLERLSSRGSAWRCTNNEENRWRYGDASRESGENQRQLREARAREGVDVDGYAVNYGGRYEWQPGSAGTSFGRRR
jgi:hypothetical protein